MPFWNYGLYIIYLGQFNQNGPFPEEGEQYDLSFAVIRRKDTEQFLSKLGLSGI